MLKKIINQATKKLLRVLSGRKKGFLKEERSDGQERKHENEVRGGMGGLGEVRGGERINVIKSKWQRQKNDR